MSARKLSTGMPEVFENENSFVRRKIVIGDVLAAIGTNYLISLIFSPLPCKNYEIALIKLVLPQLTVVNVLIFGVDSFPFLSFKMSLH